MRVDRGELADQRLQSINTLKENFFSEFAKFSKFVTDLNFNKKSKKELIPILFASYLCEHLEALKLITMSNITVPFYGVLRSVFEVSFKLQYLSNDDEISTRGKTIEFSSLDSHYQTNKRFEASGSVGDIKIKTHIAKLDARKKSLNLAQQKKPSFETILKTVLVEWSGKDGDVISSQEKIETFELWYAKYAILSYSIHADIDTLSKHYENDVGDVNVIKLNRDFDLELILSTAIELMGIAGNALEKMFPLRHSLQSNNEREK
jgi:hypothetical protein